MNVDENNSPGIYFCTQKNVASIRNENKDFIFNYDKNDSYRVKKTKVSSMLGSKLHFVGLYEDGSQIVSIPDCIQQINSRRLVPIEI